MLGNPQREDSVKSSLLERERKGGSNDRPPDIPQVDPTKEPPFADIQTYSRGAESGKASEISAEVQSQSLNPRSDWTNLSPVKRLLRDCFVFAKIREVGRVQKRRHNPPTAGF